MKTISYNPSSLEVEIANSIDANKEMISNALKGRKITEVEHQLNVDNPTLRIHIQDDDGDKHLLIIKLIQKPDGEVEQP